MIWVVIAEAEAQLRIIIFSAFGKDVNVEKVPWHICLSNLRLDRWLVANTIEEVAEKVCGRCCDSLGREKRSNGEDGCCE